MSRSNPLGVNYGWISPADQQFRSREIAEGQRVAFAIAATLADPELRVIQSSLSRSVVLAIDVGVDTLHVRIYDRDAVRRKKDRLLSRSGANDTATYLIFTEWGGLEPASAEEVESAKTHIPYLYATRHLSLQRVKALDAIQLQLTNRSIKDV